jgi:hypothetical protein
MASEDRTLKLEATTSIHLRLAYYPDGFLQVAVDALLELLAASDRTTRPCECWLTRERATAGQARFSALRTALMDESSIFVSKPAPHRTRPSANFS